MSDNYENFNDDGIEQDVYKRQILGLAIVMIGSSCSAMSGPLNSVTAISQSIVGLPIYSGLIVRFGAYFVFLALAIVYFLSYGKKIKKEKTRSYVYGKEHTAIDANELLEMCIRDSL